MYTKTIIGFCLMLTALVVASEVSAQRVPASVKKTAAQHLSCNDPDVSAAKVGPRKIGYIAGCGDTEGAIFEKTEQGLKKLLQFSSPMRSQWSFNDRKPAHKGYYDFGWITLANSGGAYVTTYRWNGTRYTLIQDDVFTKL